MYNFDETKHIQGTIKMNYYAVKASILSGKEETACTKHLMYVLLNPENLVNIVIVILACLGWYNPFFYAIMTLDILRRSDTLKNVLLVITKNKKSLILILILLII